MIKVIIDAEDTFDHVMNTSSKLEVRSRSLVQLVSKEIVLLLVLQ